MALVTLCPGCGTTFRVNAVQLQAHSGEVRCGRCHRLFNGFATLITVNESEIEYPTRSHEQPQHQSAAHSVHEKASSTESLAGMSHTNDEPGPKSDPDWNQKILKMWIILKSLKLSLMRKRQLIHPGADGRWRVSFCCCC